MRANSIVNDPTASDGYRIHQIKRTVSMEKTLEKTVLLLSQNSWIYDFKLTRVLLDRPWEKAPIEWCLILQNMTFEDMAGIPFGHCQLNWPSTLKQFIQDCLSLSISREQYRKESPSFHQASKGCHFSDSETPLIYRNHEIAKTDSEETPNDGGERVRQDRKIHCMENIYPLSALDITDDIRKGMSEKKVHEVCHMTSLIDHVIKRSECNVVVDVGSGLGYLGQVLHSKFGHPVLGLEGKQCHTAGAEKRSVQNSLCPHLHNVTCELQQTRESSQELLFLVKNWFDSLSHGGSTCRHQTGSSVSALKNSNICPKSDSHSRKCPRNDFITSEAVFKASATHVLQEIYDTTNKSESDAKSNQQRYSALAAAETDSRTIANSGVTLEKDSFQSVISTPTVDCTIEYMGSVQGESTPATDWTVDCTSSVQNMISTTIVDCTDSVQSMISTPTVDCTVDCMGSVQGESTRTVDCTVDCMGSVQREYKHSLLNHDIYVKNETVAEDGGKEILCKCNESDRIIREIEEFKLPQREPQVCMVGLHCCGDLTPTMLKCFRELDCIRSLCCVSCCYHRMKYNEESGHFENFPMSSCVKKIIDRVSSSGSGWFLSSFGMRLAAQETRARWQSQTAADHDFHIRNVAYRGILEVCLQKGQYSLKKTSRKLAHQKDFNDFSSYCQSVSNHISIPDTEAEHSYQQDFLDEMNVLYSEYQQYFCYLEPITALQVLLQPVIESLLYLDRKMWLLEKGMTCDIVPIFDEFISPRNLALIAVK